MMHFLHIGGNDPVRDKQQQYEKRMRSSEYSTWDPTSIVVAFFQYRLMHSSCPSAGLLKGESRPKGLPSIDTVKRYYCDYAELCQIVEEKYNKYNSWLRAKKAQEIFLLSQQARGEA